MGKLKTELIVFCRFLWYNINYYVSQYIRSMKISYKNLWILHAHRKMSKAELKKLADIDPATYTKLRRNQEVALSVLLKIADVLDCDAGDMMSFVKDNVPVITEDFADITLD